MPTAVIVFRVEENSALLHGAPPRESRKPTARARPTVGYSGVVVTFRPGRNDHGRSGDDGRHLGEGAAHVRPSERS